MASAKKKRRSAPKKARAKAPKPEAGEITASAAAERLGLTKQAIGLWTAKPGAPVRREGTAVFVKWPDFARWREQELLREKKQEEPKGSWAQRQLEAEARSAEIRLEMQTIELAKKRAEAVSPEDYGAALGVVLDRLTARLRGLPPRLSHFGPEVEAAIEAETERIVEELAAWDEDVIEEEPETPPEAPGAAA